MDMDWSKLPRWARKGENRREDMAEMTESGQGNEMGGGAAAAQDGAEQVAGQNELEAVEQELQQATTERDQLRERLLRLQAEFDNARRREAKERQDAREYAVQGAVEPFLGVMDNFGLALKAEGSAEQLKAGVEMILRQMEDALKGLQVQPIESVGAQFDPRVHEALGSVETKEFPDHQVLEEIRRGYRLRDKLLRPAMVRIAVNPSQVSE